MNELSELFKLVSEEKKRKKEEFESLVGDFGLDSIFEEVSVLKTKSKIKNKKGHKALKVFEDFLSSKEIEPINEEVISEIVEVVEELQEELEEPKQPTLMERSLGLLAEPSNTKVQKDPLTPLDQKFVTLDDLQNHYSTFLSRIQQQLSTLGGGGETRLEFLDDVNRNSVKVDHKFLRYDLPSQKWIGAYAGEAPFISSTTYITSPSYTITENDYYIGVNYAGAVTITLPTNVITGTTYIVKDELGEASKGTNRYITILPSGSDTIDGRDRAILAYDYGSLTFVYRNGWRVV
jgi:hypothetical protein